MTWAHYLLNAASIIVCLACLTQYQRSPHKRLVAWMGASGFLGIANAGLCLAGVNNSWTRSLWIVSNLALLYPWLASHMGQKFRDVSHGLIGILGIALVVTLVNSGDTAKFHSVASVVALSITMVSVISCRNCLVLCALAAAFSADLVVYSASWEWYKIDPPYLAWSIRNTIWLAAHVSMAYLVTRR